MSAQHAAAQVRDAIDNLRSQNVKERQLVDVLALSEELSSAMGTFFTSIDQSVRDEFAAISQFISKARQEIGDLRPTDIRNKRLPAAGEELEAIVQDTEVATEKIMQTAEDVLALSPEHCDDYDQQVQAKMLDIIEACSFQDLTGQRVSKVVNALQHIEERMSRFATEMGIEDHESPEEPLSDEEKRRRDLLLNGPAIGGPETSQDDIDKMFDEGNDVSQDDIDALFA